MLRGQSEHGLAVPRRQGNPRGEEHGASLGEIPVSHRAASVRGDDRPLIAGRLAKLFRRAGCRRRDVADDEPHQACAWATRRGQTAFRLWPRRSLAPRPHSGRASPRPASARSPGTNRNVHSQQVAWHHATGLIAKHDFGLALKAIQQVEGVVVRPGGDEVPLQLVERLHGVEVAVEHDGERISLLEKDAKNPSFHFLIFR
jgi:hypothetical protein